MFQARNSSIFQRTIELCATRNDLFIFFWRMRIIFSLPKKSSGPCFQLLRTHCPFTRRNVCVWIDRGSLVRHFTFFLRPRWFFPHANTWVSDLRKSTPSCARCAYFTTWNCIPSRVLSRTTNDVAFVAAYQSNRFGRLPSMAINNMKVTFDEPNSKPPNGSVQPEMGRRNTIVCSNVSE